MRIPSLSKYSLIVNKRFLQYELITLRDREIGRYIGQNVYLKNSRISDLVNGYYYISLQSVSINCLLDSLRNDLNL